VSYSNNIYSVTVEELIGFAQSFLPPDEAIKIFKNTYLEKNVFFDICAKVTEIDRQIAEKIIRESVGVVDEASVGNLVTAFIDQGSLDIKDVVRIIAGARVFFEFMQELVQSSIEHISQGISVVDQQMRMVAWNKRYQEFFDYPEGYVRIGRPVADLIRFNLERTGCKDADLDAEVDKRINYLKMGQPHNFERYRPEGRVLEVSGNPMPGGGFVTSYTDITSHKELESQLRKANETLEQRVQERTRALEAANYSKSRFLAATSHDLMQPLNAAGLFASALEQKITDPELRLLTANITSSLNAADDLLNSLLEVSRIDSGAIKPKLQSFQIEELISALDLEFTALATSRGLKFRKLESSQVVYSDIRLLRRILQNFLSNAIRYTPTGKVVLGCRVRAGICRIEVWDTGVGVPYDKREEIFQEFRRVKQKQLVTEEGLGLGLAIADRLSKLLEHPIHLRSWPGKGSVFSVDVPLAKQRALEVPPRNHPPVQLSRLSGRKVLCVDNDAIVLQAMRALLEGWDCLVLVATDTPGARSVMAQYGQPEIILADYQLDDGMTGLELLGALEGAGKIPAIVITANNTEDVRREVEARGYRFLAKPVKPASLRAVMSSLLG
jgi:signal transduction histidine kinase